ncbi:MAG TPA: hypothetical protein VKF28_00910 [Candidatus Dormibacteraeota bacterium]|nr:hypothetical protein [Candidatus Dormibacteraeota bacterium]
MISIRKFVGYTGTAAGIIAAFALAASAQTAVAAAPWNQSPATEATVSPQCTAAFQDIKAAAAADRSEDATERAVAKTNPDLTADRAEDSTERANFVSLFRAARTACAPAAAAPLTTKFAPSSACTSAIQALKAAWAQGRPTTQTQWMQLQTLAQAARAACGGWTEHR